jgi:hypothetical protein
MKSHKHSTQNPLSQLTIDLGALVSSQDRRKRFTLAVQSSYRFLHLLITAPNPLVAERPQHMFMRVAVGLHGEDIDSAVEVRPTSHITEQPPLSCLDIAHLQTYNLMSEGWFTHASPTLFNSGTPRNQLSRYRHSLFFARREEENLVLIMSSLIAAASSWL